ncbi:MAG: zinc ABC transporter substrate-binding protein [Phycisphaerales bacterium]|nr:zinc ABC transporter substrate-binding protein [Phycisphaerales bacterium]
MKPGEDPHTYDVRPRDAQTLTEAKLVLFNGLHLESTLLHIIENNAKQAKIVALAEDPRITPIGSDANRVPPTHTAGLMSVTTRCMSNVPGMDSSPSTQPTNHCTVSVPMITLLSSRNCMAG